MVIVDVEATCWKDRQPPPGQQSEIIEIGICLFDPSTLTLSGKRSILIHPTRSKVSAFCTKLTTLTQARVAEEGIWFEDACKILEEDYHTRSRTWASWGNYDQKMFAWQCEDRQVPYPFGEQHLNVKSTFGRLHGLSRNPGMSMALRMARLELEGTHHRGHDDAWNIGRLLIHLVETFGSDLLQIT